MKCGSCGSATRDGQRFCEACGATLEKKCPGCGATAPAVARFCGTCGSTFPVDAGTPANPTAPASVAAPAEALPLKPGEGERRQLTVMFADVVGATVLSGRLDPEALRVLLRAYQQVCVECTERYGGHIHQYAGDGVLAYFGYPAAHDNDAERAVLAGLDIVEGTRRLAADLRQRGEEAIAVRVGIHTGMVVVGEMGAGQRARSARDRRDAECRRAHPGRSGGRFGVRQRRHRAAARPALPDPVDGASAAQRGGERD